MPSKRKVADLMVQQKLVVFVDGLGIAKQRDADLAILYGG